VSDDKGVVVDDSVNIVTALDIKEPLIASFEWDSKGARPTDTAVELAAAALTSLDIKVFSNNDRMYTIPDSVIAEAKRGLAWRKEEDRGGTSVGLNTARTLARGGQIGIRKVRHIAKYFPRHQVDKKGTGYKPGQKNYPSNGRIAWALWGGDAAWSWTRRIVRSYEARDGAKMFTQERRMKLAKEGIAMPDGSYPIVSINDLKNAIQAFGRAKDPEATKKHIMKRARSLNAEDLIPENWMK
jgi:hypothetical protein